MSADPNDPADDAMDRLLTAAFRGAEDPVPDDAFVRDVLTRVERRHRRRHLVLGAAASAGAILAVEPAAGLVQCLGQQSLTSVLSVPLPEIIAASSGAVAGLTVAACALSAWWASLLLSE